MEHDAFLKSIEKTNLQLANLAMDSSLNSINSISTALDLLAHNLTASSNVVLASVSALDSFAERILNISSTNIAFKVANDMIANKINLINSASLATIQAATIDKLSDAINSTVTSLNPKAFDTLKIFSDSVIIQHKTFISPLDIHIYDEYVEFPTYIAEAIDNSVDSEFSVFENKVVVSPHRRRITKQNAQAHLNTILAIISIALALYFGISGNISSEKALKEEQRQTELQEESNKLQKQLIQSDITNPTDSN